MEILLYNLMYKCPQCLNNLSTTEIKCPICHNYFWRLPHIIIGAILTLTVGITAILALDHFAVNQIPQQSNQTNTNFRKDIPGRSNPNNPRPPYKRQLDR